LAAQFGQDRQTAVEDMLISFAPPNRSLLKPAPGHDGPVRKIFAALRRHRMLAVALACAIGLAAAYTAYRWNSDTSGAPVLVAATRGDVENLVTAIGNLQPLNTVDVGAQVSGQLKTLYVKIGDGTHKGDLVAEIDTPVAAAKVDADKAQLQNLRAQLSDKLSAGILTTAQAGRQTRLKNDGATSQDAFDIAQSAQKSGAAQVKAVQAQITQAESTLKADQATLGYAKIYAPMTGTVTAIAAKEGQTLNANQQAPNILTISDLATMTVYTQVSEADVPKLHLGMDAYFTTLGNATRRYSGKLRQVLPTPAVVNNVVLYTALFDVGNPDRNLMPQMTAQVFFVLGAAHDVVIVPVAALKYADAAQPGAGPRAATRQPGMQNVPARRRAAMVTVVQSSGNREDRNVVVGITNRVDAEIVSGLAMGEKVIAGTQAATTVRTARPVTAGAAVGAGGFGRGGP
jgi:macrolide-specific efflux system membrane fusion protein